MSEIDLSPENLKIPENWKFPERRKEDIEVIQMDKGEGFLAFSLNRDLIKLNIDYFFSTNGVPIYKKNNYINLPTYQDYIEKYGENHVRYDLRKIGGLGSDLDKMKNRGKVGEAMLEVYFYDRSVDAELDSSRWTKVPLNEIIMSPNGELVYIALSDAFMTEGNMIRAPSMVLSLGERETEGGLREAEWKLNLSTQEEHRSFGFVVQDQEKPNELVFVNRQGKKEYVVVWDTIIEEDREGRKVPFFVVTQSHFDADDEETRKILRSPVQIDIEKIKSAVLTKPPYPQDERGRLVVPWINIDRIVGASLSYSYPPPKTS